MPKRFSLLTITLLMVMLITACNIPKTTPPAPFDMVRTYAAQTVESMTTRIAATDAVSDVPTSESPPTETPIPEETQPPSPSETPLPTDTQPIGSTLTPTGVCDRAGFVSETIPDKSDFLPNSTFRKTWTLKNIGTCTWSASYAVVFTSGNALNAPAGQQLTAGTVAPGETVAIAMDLTAPSTLGRYKAEFKLRNADGVIFGFGDDNKTFWAEIDVVASVYDLVENYCAAEWTSSAGVLACPGKDSNTNGFVYRDDTPKLEGGYQDDEPALWMGPQAINNGFVKGTYPAQRIPSGMRFSSIIGCHPDATDCNVVMSINYSEGGGPMQTIAFWSEVNEGIFRKVSVDLSFLAGKTVQFILIVDANGSFTGDKVHWMVPKIRP